MGYAVSDENTIRRGKPHNFTRAILSTAVISMIPLTGKTTVALEKKTLFIVLHSWCQLGKVTTGILNSGRKCYRQSSDTRDNGSDWSFVTYNCEWCDIKVMGGNGSVIILIVDSAGPLCGSKRKVQRRWFTLMCSPLGSVFSQFSSVYFNLRNGKAYLIIANVVTSDNISAVAI